MDIMVCERNDFRIPVVIPDARDFKTQFCDVTENYHSNSLTEIFVHSAAGAKVIAKINVLTIKENASCSYMYFVYLFRFNVFN